MKRTKEWWAALTKEERCWLVMAERLDAKASFMSDPYLPEGYSECVMCSTPTRGGGLCRDCYAYWKSLVDKADAAVRERRKGCP